MAHIVMDEAVKPLNCIEARASVDLFLEDADGGTPKAAMHPRHVVMRLRRPRYLWCSDAAALGIRRRRAPRRSQKKEKKDVHKRKESALD